MEEEPKEFTLESIKATPEDEAKSRARTRVARRKKAPKLKVRFGRAPEWWFEGMGKRSGRVNEMLMRLSMQAVLHKGGRFEATAETTGVADPRNTVQAISAIRAWWIYRGVAQVEV